MQEKYLITALIPARQGTKTIVNKNIKLFNGMPLLYWSIKIAKQCPFISEIAVSTDSQEIAALAESYGASVPFLRPKEISNDLSTDYQCINHYLSSIDKKPDIIAHLRPTYPIRNISLLNSCMETFIENYNNYDSLRTVTPSIKTPFKTYIIQDNSLLPLFPVYENIREPYNRCRQELPQTYMHNGCIDIIKTSIINQQESISGQKIYPYIMHEKIHDIDTQQDWEIAEAVHKLLA